MLKTLAPRSVDRLDVNAPDLLSYDRVIVAYSGGKDCTAAFLALLEAGVPADRIELWHHDVDGAAGPFMDWPVTVDYCRRVAESFGVPLYLSFREGGFERELDRLDAPTAPVRFELPGGGWGTAGGEGKPNTRGQFPQVSPDLSVRWCSSVVKIDVMAAAIRNQSRFLSGRTLVVTGERAEESPNRARYRTFEPHRTDTRDGTRRARHVDHWRPVHDWAERSVWAILQRWGVVPHVAYQIGWGRLSCLSCIFGSPDQWATIAAVFPAFMARIETKEAGTGKTIQRKASVRELASRGTPYPAALARPDLVALAMSHVWSLPVRVDPAAWVLPAGAFGESAGPV